MEAVAAAVDGPYMRSICFSGHGKPRGLPWTRSWDSGKSPGRSGTKKHLKRHRRQGGSAGWCRKCTNGGLISVLGGSCTGRVRAASGA